MEQNLIKKSIKAIIAKTRCLWGQGQTTCQMRAAPRAALFIWRDEDLTYPKALAQHLGRSDLRIKPASILITRKYISYAKPTGIVLDHAVQYNEAVRRALAWAVLNSIPVLYEGQ